VIYLGLAGSVLLVGYLARRIALERERTVRSETDERGAKAQLQTVRFQLKEARGELARMEEDRARRASVVEGEMGALRRALAEAQKERDAFREKYRTASGDRDRAMEDLLAARRDLELLRNDLARATARAAAAAASARARTEEAEEARLRLAESTARVEALLGPLLQDLRSPDGSIRVRAHEALCAFAGKQLEFRAGGTPEEIEADAKAIETLLLGKAGGK
jgi:chromosome segregation ATPase